MAVVYLQKGNQGANAIALLQLLASIYEKEKDRETGAAREEIGLLQDTGAEVEGEYLQELERRAGFQPGTLMNVATGSFKGFQGMRKDPATGEADTEFPTMEVDENAGFRYSLPTKGYLEAKRKREQLPLISEEEMERAKSGRATQPIKSETERRSVLERGQTDLDSYKMTGNELQQLIAESNAYSEKIKEVAKRKAITENQTPEEKAKIEKMEADTAEALSKSKYLDRMPQEHKNWLYSYENSWAEGYRKRLADWNKENEQLYKTTNKKGQKLDKEFAADSDELKDLEKTITEAGYEPVKTQIRTGMLGGKYYTVKPGIPKTVQERLNKVDSMTSQYSESGNTGNGNKPAPAKEPVKSPSNSIGQHDVNAGTVVTTKIDAKTGKPSMKNGKAQTKVVKYVKIVDDPKTGNKEAIYWDDDLKQYMAVIIR